MTRQFSTSLNVCFCINWEKQTKWNMHWYMQKTWQKHSLYYRLLLEERVSDFNNLWHKYFWQLAIKWLFKFSPHPTSASALPVESRPSKIRVEMTEKTSTNFIYRYPDTWPPTASRLQGLTVMQQCLYQMTFRDVSEFKKRLVQPGLVWSRTLSILLSVNRESVSMPVFVQWTNISSNFIAGSWNMKQLGELSAKVSKMWIKYVVCALFRLGNNRLSVWVKIHIFLVLFSLDSAWTYVGWDGKLNGHLKASCLWNIFTKNYLNLLILF